MHLKFCAYTLSREIGLNHYGHIQSTNGSASAIAGDALRPLFFALPNLKLGEAFTYKEVYTTDEADSVTTEWHQWAVDSKIVLHLASANFSVDREETFRNYLYELANSVADGSHTLAEAMNELDQQHYRDPPNKVPKMRHWIATESPDDLLAFKMRFL